MDDVKDKLKDFMKKVNKPFASSSSGKFKGQGRVLGSASSDPSSPSPAANRTLPRPAPVAGASAVNPPRSANPKPSSPSESGFKIGDGDGGEAVSKGGLGEFSGFEPIFSSGKRTANGASLNVFECSVCCGAYRAEEEVTEHVDGCLNYQVSNLRVEPGDAAANSNLELRSEIAARIGVFVYREPSEASVEVVVKLLKNIGKEPENGKFRRIRMGNPKIKEALGTAGGVEVLEGVGFRLQEEGDGLWAAMEVPSEERMVALKEAIALLERVVCLPIQRMVMHLLKKLSR